MSDPWFARLAQAGVPHEVIRRIYERYGSDLPEHVIQALIHDDHRSGIGWLSAPSNDPVIAEHDGFHLLEQLGYPIERFPYEAQLRAVKDGLLSGKSILWILGASLGGAAIMSWRYLTQ